MGMPESNHYRRKSSKRNIDPHQPNTLAKRVGKRIHHVDSRCDPFCESVVSILGLAERGNLLPKDGEDGLGGMAGFEAGKEWMRC